MAILIVNTVCGGWRNKSLSVGNMELTWISPVDGVTNGVIIEHNHELLVLRVEGPLWTESLNAALNIVAGWDVGCAI